LAGLLFAASTQAATRLAVVDVGSKEQVPAAFLDLLTVELSRQPDVVLLERTEVNKLFREHALKLTTSGSIDINEVVNVGRLWTTDAFLMLEDVTSEMRNVSVRVRLVETRQGLKLSDFTVELPPAQEYGAFCARIARRVATRLSHVSDSSKPVLYAGVTTVSSEEPSARFWDYLSETIMSGLERQLAQYSGVVVLEREKTGNLNIERTLATGLPEKLRASAVLIDGSFRLDRKAGPDKVVIYIRCRDAKKELFEQERTVSANGIETACRELAHAIVQRFTGRSAGDLDVDAEAQLLAAEAEHCLRVDDSVRAVGPAEAALALAPSNLTYKLLLLRSLGLLSEQYVHTEADPNELLLRLCSSRDRQFDLATELLATAPTGTLYCAVHETAVRLLDPLPTNVGFPSNAMIRTVYREAQKRQYELCDQLYSTVEKVQPMPFVFRDLLLCKATCDGGGWYPSATSALAARRKFYEKAMIAFQNDSHAVACRALMSESEAFSVHPFWSDRERAPELIHQFYVDLSHSEEPLLRLAGEQVLLWEQHDNYAQPKDREIAHQHAKRLAEIAATEVYPRYPSLIQGIHTSISVALDNVLDRGAKAELMAWYYARVPKELIPTDLTTSVRPPLPKQFHWVKLLDRNTCTNWSSTARAMIRFRRLEITDAGPVLIYSDGPYQAPKLGALWLDPRSWQPVQYRCDEESIQNFYEYIGSPDFAVAADGQVYVSATGSGLIVFSRDIPQRRLRLRDGLVSDSLWHLQIVGNKLYGLFNPSTKNAYEGLMELDLTTGLSRVICSIRDKQKATPLNGCSFFGLAADSAAGQLWLRTDKGEFYTYSTATGVTERRRIAVLENRSNGMFSDCDELRGYDVFAVNFFVWPSLIHLPSGRSVELPTVLRQSVLNSGRLIPAGDGVVSTSLLYWHPPTEPIDLLARSDGELPSRHIRDLKPTANGLLVVTDTALYCIPEIKGQPKLGDSFR